MSAVDKLTEAERLAETLGVIIGAASCCEEVTEERLDSVVTKLRPLVLATANDGADAASANERFSVAIDAGRTAAESGQIDPEDAEAALCEMEAQLST
jgi:thiazole synthase ThiGH ThiG subunit